MVAEASTTLWNNTPYQQFGYAVGSTDVNGDGCDDLLVGAPQAYHGSLMVGIAPVFLGGPAGASTERHRVLVGNAAAGTFGEALGGFGDVNGDGFGDFGVGARQAGPAQNGSAHYWRGSVDGVAETPTLITTGALRAELGTSFAR